MFDISIDKVDLSGFMKDFENIHNIMKEEIAVALVNTREDFLSRVADILGSVPKEGGPLPSPYAMVYQKLSVSWVTYKRKHGLQMPIGVATGETKAWLQGFAEKPGLIITQGNTLSIDAGVLSDGTTYTPQGKIYAMEFGYELSGQPARPIFQPAVVWYLANETDNPFYHEMQVAFQRVIERINGKG